MLIVNHWHGTIWETWVHHVSKFYTPPIPIPLKLLHFNSKQMDFVRCHSHIVKWIGGLSYSKAAEYGSTPPPPRQEVIIYLEYKCLLKWGFVGTFHLDDDYIPVVNLLDPQKWIGPRGGTVWIPQWGVSGSLPINWMGVAFQKQRHRNRKMMKHEDIQPTPKKTWENGKPSLCYCQLCQTRSSRCLRRNRT